MNALMKNTTLLAFTLALLPAVSLANDEEMPLGETVERHLSLDVPITEWVQDPDRLDEELGDTIASVLGLGTVTYNAVDADAYRGFGFPGADELGNMFQVYRDFEAACLGARSVEKTRALNPALQSFEDFVKAKKQAIEAAINS